MFSLMMMLFRNIYLLLFKQLRRLQLKSDQGLGTRSAEVREGDTYSSDIMGMFEIKS